MAEVPAITGGCQCGSVRYVLSRPPEFVYTCHCTVCRKVSSSAFNVSCIVAEDSLSIKQGDLARVDWVVESGAKRFGEYCSRCGVRILHGSVPSNGQYAVRGGTLDNQVWAQPVAHQWLSEAVSWFTPPDGDLQYQTQPADRSAVAALYKKRHGEQLG